MCKMDCLPVEILAMIFTQCSKGTKCICAKVNNNWRLILGNNLKSNKIAIKLARDGNLDLLLWSLNNGAEFDWAILRKAAAHGHLRIIKYFLNEDNLLYHIAKTCHQSHYELLKGFLSINKLAILQKNVIPNAFSNGHANVFRWMLEKQIYGVHISLETLHKIIQNNHFKMVKLLFSNGIFSVYPISKGKAAIWCWSFSELTMETAKIGNVEMAEWLKKNHPHQVKKIN